MERKGTAGERTYVKITKMHALGNNYIYVEANQVPQGASLPDLAVAVSDIRKGIGSDGLIVVGPSEHAAIRMQIFNADGSEAENCGNGVRCVAKYAYDHGLVHDRAFAIETGAGVVSVTVHVDEGPVRSVTVNMGRPRFGSEAVPFAGALQTRMDTTVGISGRSVEGSLVSMGNPHFVTFVADANQEDVAAIGPLIERHPWFPERVNVEFVTPVSRQELDFRVWERGSGITWACGTGACASVAAGVAKGLLDDRVTVHLLGGDLEVEMVDGEVWMTGEAVTVLEGELEADWLERI